MRYLAAVLTFLLLLFSGSALAERSAVDTSTEGLQRLAKWAGCDATVVEGGGGPNAAYGDTWGGPMIVLLGLQEAPPEIRLMIVLHETGHCLQDKAGTLDEDKWLNGRVDIELDADRQAANLACSLGLNGPRLLHDLFVWFNQLVDYEGDENHGALAQRIAMGPKADHCHPVGVQAP